ncbi:MAG: hypothetical protein H5T95_04540 [Firmicutes bacterium]|nr:hypothetical protein [Bacillota bacterium]
MSLTERSREFLAALRKLYEEQKGPVHYEDVAKAVGVSKWTAYDMLRKLAAHGLVGVEYILNRHKRTPGRSMVMFRPNEVREDAEAWQMKHGGHLPFGEELARIKKHVVASLPELRSSASQGIWQGLMEKLDRASGPAAFCGYMAVLLVACTRLLGGNSLDVLARLVQAGADAHSALVVFSGAIMGMLVVHPTVSQEVTGKMAGYMRKFHDHIDSLSGQERSLLLEFVREIAGPA